MVKQKIIDHHGRVDNIQLYDKDPTVFKKEEEAAERAREKEKEGEAEEAEAEAVQEEKLPQYKTFDNSSTTLYEIFGQYGVEMKKELEDDTEEAKNARGTLYYDFTPYNSKDPVLLSLMTAKHEDP